MEGNMHKDLALGPVYPRVQLLFEDFSIQTWYVSALVLRDSFVSPFEKDS